MINQQIIDNFKKLIKLIIIETNNQTNSTEKTINKFKIQSLKRSLKIIIEYPNIIKNGNELSHLKGIGKGTIDRINEIIKTGTLIELINYDKIIAKSASNELIINDLMSVVGIGRTIAQQLISKYKIKSALELKTLSDENRIKLNDKLKIGLKYLGKFHGAIPRSEIDKIYDYLQDLTDKYDKSMFITICGSYRRGLPISSDIDILLSNINLSTMDDIINSSKNHLALYVRYLHQIGFLLDDITDKNIQTKYMGFGQLNKKYKIRRIDIRFIPMISYFPALLYFTGSYELNQLMRYKAKKLNYKLNEYGLFDSKGQQIIVLSEQEIFHKLNMEYLTPDNR
jgi:DNA polymerase/3'-5' exonuclease PolX